MTVEWEEDDMLMGFEGEMVVAGVKVAKRGCLSVM